MTDAPRCTAHKADTLEPCKAFAIRGGSVCVYHGGSIPAVRNKALERLAALVDPAITRLNQLILASTPQDSVSMRAVTDLLDRAGFSAQRQLKLSGDSDAPLEIVIQRGPRSVDPEPPE